MGSVFCSARHFLSRRVLPIGSKALPTVLPTGYPMYWRCACWQIPGWPVGSACGSRRSSLRERKALPTALPTGENALPTALPRGDKALPTVLPTGEGSPDGPPYGREKLSLREKALPTGEKALPTVLPTGHSSPDGCPSAHNQVSHRASCRYC